MQLKSTALPSKRAIEFFAGIGGLSAACPFADCVAYDISRRAEATYRRNFSHAFHVREIESLSDREIIEHQADLWWLSPPCQPYSVRGNQRDTQDPRSRPLLRLIDAIPACLPQTIALENVPGFAQSEAHHKLEVTLRKTGYQVQTLHLCPSQMGWPNRRPRFYVLASLSPLVPWTPLPQYDIPLPSLLEALELDQLETLWLSESLVQKFESALDRVDGHTASLTACFGSSYGKSLLRAGSYLQQGERYRYFTPREVARLLGFDDSFLLDHLARRAAWKLLGNSLSLPAVRYVMQHL